MPAQSQRNTAYRVDPAQPRSAVLTGSARGIGRAIAVELVAVGYEVVVTDIDATAASRTAAEIGAVAGMALDVTDERANRDIAAAARAYAPLGAWVNNAGVGFEGTVADQESGKIRALVDINFLGVIWGCRAAIDAFRTQALDGARRRAGDHRLPERPRPGTGLVGVRRDEGGGPLAGDLTRLRAAT